MSERKGYPSASSLKRLIACRGSWLAEQNMPTTSVGKFERDEGTDLHDVCESGKIPDHLDEEQRWAVNTALNLKEKFYEEFNLVGQIMKEVRLWAKDEEDNLLYSGKFDEAVIGDDFAVLIDYKFGRKPVDPAPSNFQMLAYAVLMWLNYPGKQIYATAIIQPRVEEELRFSRAVYTITDLKEAYAGFVAAIREAQEPNQKRTPSYDSCEYCKALHVCPDALHHFTNL